MTETNIFQGFSAQDRHIIVPEPFFSDLLPLINDVAELKLTLFCMWALQQREGRYRYLTWADFTSSASLMDGLQATAPDAPPKDTLAATLERVVAHGVLLPTQISRSDGGELKLYFMNSARGREALAAIEQGRASFDEHEQVEILPPRPTIYRLYEQEIGTLTPMISDDLKDLQSTYSEEWLRDAIRVAVREEKRSLKYVAGVLLRWRKQGKTNDEINPQNEPMVDDGYGRRFITGKYADFIDH